MTMENKWNENLFDCCNDCGICCYGYWCPCCLFGSNSKKASDKNCCLMCCIYAITAGFYLCWVPHMLEREKIRKKYDLKEEPCGDCPTTLCCGPCALCQEAREMKSREKRQNVAYKANVDAPIVSQPKGYSNDVQSEATPYNIQQGGNPYNSQPGGNLYNIQQGGNPYNIQQGANSYMVQPGEYSEKTIDIRV